jgi:adenylate/nucleoside-diphosphate kinase
MDSETGKKCSEILNRGEAISEDMVLKMIEEKVNSPEVAHHGKLMIP